MHHPLAYYDGFCAGCHGERPLVLLEHGQRGVRAWLAGMGHEDRSLTYACLVCGRTEQVPHTEAEDVIYDATLATWPDTFRTAPCEARAPLVRLITLPRPRVSATDDRPLVLAVA